MLRTEHRFWHPAGVRPLTMPEPGVSLRSTPGYLLASLQDVSGRLLRLASIPLETAIPILTASLWQVSQGGLRRLGNPWVER